MFDNKGRFIIENYNKQSTFSSFLPGISGLEGIPIWCFYVNRGQAIASFGVEDKNHSIMEFYPAHQAYQMTQTMGFRTFLKVDGVFYEPFSSNEEAARLKKQGFQSNTEISPLQENEMLCVKMYIGMNELEIEEMNTKLGIQVNVLYYTLPNEALGGLVRKVTIQNLQDLPRKLEVVDGLPAILPYGIELKDFKEMAQTMKAWMQVEDVDIQLPYYRARYSTKDSAKVSRIEEGNFYFAITEEGRSLPVLADPEILFDYDTSCQLPAGFLDCTAEELANKKQVLQNQVPSGFSIDTKIMKRKEKVTIFSVGGHTADKACYHKFARRCLQKGYFETKYEQAVRLTRDLSKGIEGKTGNAIFDAYCRQTYIDNILRGGYPIPLGKDHIFYVYSRKHGDIERDYNFFKMLPEYYSQGNGNYRDVNQNRRSDVRFLPYVKDYNIKTFYNLIQLDGFNPLIVKQVTYQLKDISRLMSYVEGEKDKIAEFFQNEFSPGELLRFLEKEEIPLSIPKEKFLEEVMNQSTQQLNADFGEGYWTDHWTYNLDLIEAYLSIYPEDEKRLLVEDCSYTYFEARAIVLPRSKRYIETENGVRQYHCVDETIKEKVKHRQVRGKWGTGEVYYTNLLTKLLVIVQNKFASLDMSGMGIEMEGGKPGWYDAMNGLPGMFGSSMAETYELLRLLNYIIEILDTYKVEGRVFEELYDFMRNTYLLLEEFHSLKREKLWVWDQVNELKEVYREKIIWGIEGTEQVISNQELITILQSYVDYIKGGIKEAINLGNGVCPTYFAYELSQYEVREGQIVPQVFDRIAMPLFLEGPVRYFKLPVTLKDKKALYNSIKKSGLYDKKLSMYKVNESLEGASFEVGRAKAFSPGWLENESIWLHMEYKYLLELLKSGFYEEFYKDFYHAGVPFMDYETYGRSLLENSSFLVSSANRNEKIHGKGFVARLSGSTAEFLELWQIMMFGEKPFQIINNELVCTFTPAIPSYLISDAKVIEATFLGSIKVTYRFNKRADIIPSNYNISNMLVQYDSGKEKRFKGEIAGDTVRDIRSGQITAIECDIIL